MIKCTECCLQVNYIFLTIGLLCTSRLSRNTVPCSIEFTKTKVNTDLGIIHFFVSAWPQVLLTFSLKNLCNICEIDGSTVCQNLPWALMVTLILVYESDKHIKNQWFKLSVSRQLFLKLHVFRVWRLQYGFSRSPLVHVSIREKALQFVVPYSRRQ